MNDARLVESEVALCPSSVAWSSDALRALEDDDWRGNVRELKHAVERVIAFADWPVIGAADVRRHAATLAALAAENAWGGRRRAELQDVLRSANWDTGKAVAILRIRSHHGVPALATGCAS